MPASSTLTVFYDGTCPVCSLEIDNLGRRCQAGELALVDISAAEFEAAAHGFVARDLNAVIHAVRADGSVLKGMDALRAAYDAAHLGWMLRWTARRPFRSAFDAGYRVFARHRRPISRGLAPLIGAIERARRAGRPARSRP